MSWIKNFLVFILFGLSFILSCTANADTSGISRIEQLPRLRAGLPAGTIAWATPDQLHPTQPQTGKREVERKADRFKSMLKDNGQSFSKELYEFLYLRSIAPAYLARTPKSDSRHGVLETLGFITDRTHGTDALSQTIKDVYGKKASSKVIYDKKGRPLNYILVRVMADKTDLAPREFRKFMIENNKCYLKKWIRNDLGETIIQDIDFRDLPEQVIQTTDNPFRGLIGELQHEKLLVRSSTEYSQFKFAEEIIDLQIVMWDEISGTAKKSKYERAFDRASKYFDSRNLAVGKQQETSETALSNRQCSLLF